MYQVYGDDHFRVWLIIEQLTRASCEVTPVARTVPRPFLRPVGPHHGGGGGKHL